MKTDNPNSVTSRKTLVQIILTLFSNWKLPETDQAVLLGLSADDLTNIHNNGILPDNLDTLDRIGWLLAIHKSLGILYPHNEEIRYSWVQRRNEAFENMTPLNLMKEQGIARMIKIANYLELYCRR